MNKIRKQLDILAKNGTTFHEKALDILDKKTLKCPQCGSDNIYIKSGMFVDLFICEECGYEWR